MSDNVECHSCEGDYDPDQVVYDNGDGIALCYECAFNLVNDELKLTKQKLAEFENNKDKTDLYFKHRDTIKNEISGW